MKKTSAEIAASNYYGRKFKLISAWGRTHAVGEFEKMNRINRIIDRIDKRIKRLLAIINESKERQIVMEYETANQFVLLECNNWDCMKEEKSTGIAIRLKEYNPEINYICPTCGRKLRTKEDRIIDDLLFDNKIKTNQ